MAGSVGERQAILDVLVRFCRGVDRLDEALIASCFHPDATDDHGMYRGSGHGFAHYVMQSAASMLGTMHTIGNVSVAFDGDIAHSEAQVHVVMRMPSGDSAADHTIHARYIDRFEQRDGGPWLIADRLVVYDLTRIDPVGRQWGLGDGYTVGRRDREDPSYK